MFESSFYGFIKAYVASFCFLSLRFPILSFRIFIFVFPAFCSCFCGLWTALFSCLVSGRSVMRRCLSVLPLAVLCVAKCHVGRSEE